MARLEPFNKRACDCLSIPRYGGNFSNRLRQFDNQFILIEHDQARYSFKQRIQLQRDIAGSGRKLCCLLKCGGSLGKLSKIEQRVAYTKCYPSLKAQVTKLHSSFAASRVAVRAFPSDSLAQF